MAAFVVFVAAMLAFLMLHWMIVFFMLITRALASHAFFVFFVVCIFVHIIFFN